MKKYLEILLDSPLFRGITGEELERLLPCLGGGARSYSAGAAILPAGTPAGQMGLVLSGRVQVAREEFSGHRSLLAELEPGDTISVTYTGGIQESYPTGIDGVVRVQLLDDEK